MESLFLTQQESMLFASLSDTLREGWKVETERIEKFETLDELFMRYKIAHFNDPRCVLLAEAARNAKDSKEFEKIAADFDLASLPQEQVAELCFVLGTRVLCAMVSYLLSRAKDDEDLEGIAVMTNIRRMLTEVNAA